MNKLRCELAAYFSLALLCAAIVQNFYYHSSIILSIYVILMLLLCVSGVTFKIYKQWRFERVFKKKAAIDLLSRSPFFISIPKGEIILRIIFQKASGRYYGNIKIFSENGEFLASSKLEKVGFILPFSFYGVKKYFISPPRGFNVRNRIIEFEFVSSHDQEIRIEPELCGRFCEVSSNPRYACPQSEEVELEVLLKKWRYYEAAKLSLVMEIFKSLIDKNFESDSEGRRWFYIWGRWYGKGKKIEIKNEKVEILIRNVLSQYFFLAFGFIIIGLISFKSLALGYGAFPFLLLWEQLKIRSIFKKCG